VEAPGPILGREVGVFVDAEADLAGVAKLRRALDKLGAEVLVIASVGGELSQGGATEALDRTLLTTRSIEFDALLVADGVVPTDDIKLLVLFQEAFRHCKTIGAWGSGDAVLEGAGIDIGAPGILLGNAVAKKFNDELVAAVGLHRAWARAELVMASD
jgi:catalase